MTEPQLSIVIPFLNEKRVLPLLRQRFENLPKRPDFWELIFVSDGSTDGSTEYVEAWSRQNPAVKLVVLTRNFGHQYAALCRPRFDFRRLCRNHGCGFAG